MDRCRFRHDRDVEDVRSAGRAGCERERDFQSHLRASSLQRRSRRHASWTNATSSRKQIETAVEKIRNARPVKINEFRVNSGAPGNPTDSFIELYNAGSQSVDLSNWTLTEHPAHQAIFSTVKIPAGTKLAAGGFYLLGLSNSGLAVPAHAGDSIIHVRNTEGMSVGDTINIGTGSSMEARKIASLGTAASNHTTLWQSLARRTGDHSSCRLDQCAC